MTAAVVQESEQLCHRVGSQSEGKRMSYVAARLYGPAVVACVFLALVLHSFLNTTMTETASGLLPTSDSEWRAALNALPSSEDTGRIPAFFFGHGSPILLMSPPEPVPSRVQSMHESMGPNSTLARFLKDFGPELIAKYNPAGIVVFSAHWETDRDLILVTDYGDNNPLLMDYYGFDQELYEVQFKSRGSSSLSALVVDTLSKHNVKARTTPRTEPRGHDGRGFAGPGLDHGVFVPFKFMFGDDFTDVPIVQVSINGSLKPADNWRLGKALEDLRSSRILILSGGLTVHNLRDPTCWTEKTAKPSVIEFHESIFNASLQPDVAERQSSMARLTHHPGFRAAHPREEHFIPIYIAAGAGEKGDVKVITASFGAPTIAFGV